MKELFRKYNLPLIFSLSQRLPFFLFSSRVLKMAAIFELELDESSSQMNHDDPSTYMMEEDHEYDNIADGTIDSAPPSSSFM